MSKILLTDIGICVKNKNKFYTNVWNETSMRQYKGHMSNMVDSLSARTEIVISAKFNYLK